MRVNNLVLGAASFAVGSIVIVMASGFPAPRHQAYGPGLFPTLIGIGLVVCGAALAFQWFRDEPGSPAAEPLEWMRSPAAAVNAALFAAAPVLYILVVNHLGFILTSFVFLFVLVLRLHGRLRPAFIIGITVPPMLQFAFADILLVPLPWGALQRFAW